MTSRSGEKSRGSGLSRALAFLTWLALLIVLPAVLYITHVLRQLDEFEHRNRRLLGQAVVRVESILENAVSTVESLGKDQKWVKDFNPYLTVHESEDFVRCWEDAYPPVEISFAPGSFHLSIEESDLLEQNHILLAAKIERTAQPPRSYEYCDERGASSSVAIEKWACQEQLPLPGEIRFHVEFGEILRDLPFSEPPYPFDYLVLVDEKGKVRDQVEYSLAPKPSRGLRFANLEGFQEKEPAVPDREGLGESLMTLLGRGGELASFYTLECQPLFMVLGEHGESVEGASVKATAWELCGVTARNRMLTQALGVAPQLALFLFLVLLFVALAWPFIKLYFMDRRERFTLRDGYFLLVSTFACLLVSTILLFDLASYWSLLEETEKRLEKIAGEVVNGLEGQLGTLRAQLQEYDSHEVLRKATGKGCFPTWAGLLQSDEFGPPGFADWFSQVFWADATGRQLAKATVRDKTTPPVNVSFREYFRRVADRRLWNPGGYFVQSFRSITTGRREMALSMQSRLTVEESSPVAAVILSQRPPVVDALLPAGFEFAVVDRLAKVQFHSDPRLALDESLFDEVAEGERLEAAMSSRTARTFRSYYRSRPRLVHVRPMQEIPWFVVTFYDLEILRTINLEAVGRAIAFALIFLVLLQLPTVIYGLFVKRHARWFWPSRTKGKLYLVVFAVLSVAAVVQAALVPFELDFWWILIPVLALGAALLAFLVFDFINEKPEKGAIRPWREVWEKRKAAAKKDKGPPFEQLLGLMPYCLVSMSLWLVVAVLPGIKFFHDTWRDQMQVLAKYEAFELVPRAAARQRSTQNLDLLGALERDVGDWPCDPASSAVKEGFRGELSRHLPIFNATSRKVRYLGAEVLSGERSWVTADDRLCMKLVDGGASLEVTASSEEGEPLRVTVPIPGRETSLALVLLGGALGTLLLWLWIRWSAWHFFFAAIPPQRDPLSVAKLRDIRGKNVIAHFACPRERMQIAAWTDRVQLDLSEIAGASQEELERLVESREAEIAKRKKPSGAPEDVEIQKWPLICQGFEASLDDDASRQRVLASLERLVFGLERKVILLTLWNPFHCLFSVGRCDWAPEAGDDEKEAPAETAAPRPISLTPGETRRWARLLAGFELQAVGRITMPSTFLTTRLWVKRGWFGELLRRHEDLSEEFQREIAEHEGYFWALWNGCSAEEQLVLVHLVDESFANPGQHNTVRGLIRRGLLERDPDLKPMSESFALFIKQIHEPLAISRLERQVTAFGWRRLRWVFLSLLIVIAIFLFATQPALFDATVGIIGALAVGSVPVLLRFLGLFQRDQARS